MLWLLQSETHLWNCSCGSAILYRWSAASTSSAFHSQAIFSLARAFNELHLDLLAPEHPRQSQNPDTGTKYSSQSLQSWSRTYACETSYQSNSSWKHRHKQTHLWHRWLQRRMTHFFSSMVHRRPRLVAFVKQVAPSSWASQHGHEKGLPVEQYGASPSSIHLGKG